MEKQSHCTKQLADDDRKRLKNLLKELYQHFPDNRTGLNTILSAKVTIDIQLCGQSSELPCKGEEEEKDDRCSQKFDFTKNENVLPISSKDMAKTPQTKTLPLKEFLGLALRSVTNIPPKHHAVLLLVCGGFLSYQGKNTNTPFDFQFKNSTNSPHSLLSFGQAFPKFFPEMAQITKFILCYFVTLMLVWPLHPGLKIIIMLLLISTPLYYFPELVRNSSGVHVSCGSFNLPLVWFTTLGALVLSFICTLLTLLMIYFSCRHINESQSRTKEIEVSFDDLAEILDGVN